VIALYIYIRFLHARMVFKGHVYAPMLQDVYRVYCDYI